MNACEGSGAVAPLRRWCGERGWTATKLMLTDCRLTAMLTETWDRVLYVTVVPLGSLYRSGVLEIGRGARTCNLTTELFEVVREKSTKAKRTHSA